MDDLVAAPEDTTYNASHIQVLKGLTAVRKRPGMYIGDTDDGSGLHHMVYEAVDNAIDEAMAGHCSVVTVIIHADGSVSVTDDGRGIPVDIHEGEGVSAAEVIMTQLHAGGKFDHNSYKVSGGLHGVGVSVVNALSAWLELSIWRDDQHYAMRFLDGVPEAPLAVQGPSGGKRGTMVHFMPSSEVFSHTIFDRATLEHRLRELAFLNPKVQIVLRDERAETDQETQFYYEGGAGAFAAYLDRNKQPLHPTVAIRGEAQGIVVDSALHWNDSYHEHILSFTNNIRQRDGGTHVIGFKAALTRVIQHYATIHLPAKKKVNLSGDDAREGLTAVLSVKVPDPKFSSQTKDKLVSSEVRPVVEALVYEKLSQWMEEHPSESRLIIQKIAEAAQARDAARKARELARRKTPLDISHLPGKLADCRERSAEKAEIFIVEGDSAGGSAKQGRDSHFQAILPLRGKILNVERARFDRMLGSEQIGTLITALGTGIGEDFSLDKLRYHKVVIMTDADVDGAHIRTLLLTFFFRHMRPLIDAGYLYIAQPPLYKLRKGQQERYLKNDAALDQCLLELGLDGVVAFQPDGSPWEAQALFDHAALAMEWGRQLQRLRRMSPVWVRGLALHGWLESSRYREGWREEVGPLLTWMERCMPAVAGETPWRVVEEDQAVRFVRDRRGVEESHRLSAGLVTAPELRVLVSLAPRVMAWYQDGLLVLQRKEERLSVEGPDGLAALVDQWARKGLAIQRFKGLGEMNADQLWETTLDPMTRSFLQVRVRQEEDADEAFSTLMGELVEPRREFIQSQALLVEHLDV